MDQPFAVITGASTSLGLELARQFGLGGYDVLVVSGDNDIFTVQEKLEEEGIIVEAIKVNLGSFAGVENLHQKIIKSGKVVDALAINTTFGPGGEFTETSLNEEIKLINLNLVSTIHLVKRILPEMKERESGKILFSSVMPSPYEAVFDASTAFIKTFADALRYEVKGRNVQITTLTPEHGTEAQFENELSEIARHGYEALMAGKEKALSTSLLTRLQEVAQKLLPEKRRENTSRSLHQ